MSAQQCSTTVHSLHLQQRVSQCHLGAKLAADRVPNISASLLVCGAPHTDVDACRGMLQEAWQLAIMATDWTSVHKGRLHMTDADLAVQLAGTAVAQAASLCYGPSSAQRMPERSRYGSVVSGCEITYTDALDRCQICVHSCKSRWSGNQSCMHISWDRPAYRVYVKSIPSLQSLALSCSFLVPVGDAAHLIEEICKAGAVDGGVEVLAAFDLGEHLCQWPLSLIRTCTGQAGKVPGQQDAVTITPCCARAGASRELQSTEQEMVMLEGDAMTD